MRSDQDFMRQAIAIAKPRVGLTGANPAVGCVLVRDGEVIASAATGEGGRPHAEEQALRQVAAGGATAYLTLEPCAQRSTGAASCARRLIEAGVVRVVIASADPSVFAAGRGAIALEQAGIAVETGFLASEAAVLLSGYEPS